MYPSQANVGGGRYTHFATLVYLSYANVEGYIHFCYVSVSTNVKPSNVAWSAQSICGGRHTFVDYLALTRRMSHVHVTHERYNNV